MELIDQLKEHHKRLIIEEIKLAEMISEAEKYQNYEVTTGISGQATADMVDIAAEQIIRITVNKLPEKLELIKGKNELYRKVSSYWGGSILNALEKLSEKQLLPRYDSIICLIKLYYKNKEWDIDNYHIKFIIDSIKHSSIIPNDSFQEVSYMIKGEAVLKDVKNYRTEIYIIPEEIFSNVIDKL